MQIHRLQLPGPIPVDQIVAQMKGRIGFDALRKELLVTGDLSSDDIAFLRGVAPHNRSWQDRMDVVAQAATPTGLYPPTLWGTFLSRLRAGESHAWSKFVDRYRAAIVASINALVPEGTGSDADQLAAEFISWLYLPGESEEATDVSRVAHALKNVQLTDADGVHVHRFRGWLRTTLRRWLIARSRRESRRTRAAMSHLAEHVSAELKQQVDAERRIDQALVCLASDLAIRSIQRDSAVHHRALQDLLAGATLEATMEWLHTEHLPSSMATASRTRSRAAELYRERLQRIYKEEFGGAADEIEMYFETLARHLGRLSRVSIHGSGAEDAHVQISSGG